jgi:hypothetical protein
MRLKLSIVARGLSRLRIQDEMAIQIRNPKAEARKKSEGRNPTIVFGPVRKASSQVSNENFGFRISAFFRISDFGLRILHLAHNRRVHRPAAT